MIRDIFKFFFFFLLKPELSTEYGLLDCIFTNVSSMKNCILRTLFSPEETGLEGL